MPNHPIPPEIFYTQVVPRKYSSAALLVPCGGKYILLKDARRDNDWGLPGGVCDRNESPRAPALREAREEIGLILEIDRLGNVNYTKPHLKIPG
ncbi:MAG: NUDIX domain-containing protein, partial [Lactobacillales bacterium]|nr:NUDIX domain-containing protein [Lactobacillales bacterium]